MVFENYEIAYRNVASKYYNVAPEELDEAVKDFLQILLDNECDPIGTMFYSIIIESTDGIMTVEIFMPILKDYIKVPEDEQVYFRSYFNVKPMIMTRVLNNIEVESPKKHRELHAYIRRNGLQQKTPVFVEYKLNHENEMYVEMSVGV